MTSRVIPYPACGCAVAARCEWGGPCGEYASASEWTPDYNTGGWRPMWLCDDHLRTWSERPDKISGLDRPPNADEFWRGSIMEMIRHALIKAAFEQRSSPAPTTVHGFTWERRLTAAQLAQLQFVRAKTREFWPNGWAA